MRKRVIRVNAITNAQLLSKVSEGVFTTHQLSEETGLCIRTIRNYLSAMHKVGVLHITDWEEDTGGRRSLKVYKLGAGKDMPKPRMSNAETRRRYRLKIRKLKQFEKFNASKVTQSEASAPRTSALMAANQGVITKWA
jgi:hypothetical protein